jgi:hypothetical protein
MWEGESDGSGGRQGVRSRKDHWFEMNPYSQRFINTCAVCGAQGYAPQIDDADFAGNVSTMIHQFSRKKLQAMLRRYYRPLALDEAGRCTACARPEDDRTG